MVSFALVLWIRKHLW